MLKNKIEEVIFVKKICFNKMFKSQKITASQKLCNDIQKDYYGLDQDKKYKRLDKKGFLDKEICINGKKYQVVSCELDNTNSNEVIGECKYEKEYDAAGNLIRETYDGVSNEKEYDAAGNLIKERPIYPSLWSSARYYEPATIYGDYGGFEFEYDSAGNMTKLIRYSFYRGEEYGYSVSQVYEYEYI